MFLTFPERTKRGKFQYSRNITMKQRIVSRGNSPKSRNSLEIHENFMKNPRTSASDCDVVLKSRQFSDCSNSGIAWQCRVYS